MRKNSKEINLKSLLLTLQELFSSIKLPMLTMKLPIAEVYVEPLQHYNGAFCEIS